MSTGHSDSCLPLTAELRLLPVHKVDPAFQLRHQHQHEYDGGASGEAQHTFARIDLGQAQEPDPRRRCSQGPEGLLLDRLVQARCAVLADPGAVAGTRALGVARA